MKLQILLPVSIALSVASFAFMKIRVKDMATEEKKHKFLDVKLRVTDDILAEYEKKKQGIENQMYLEKGMQDEIQKLLGDLAPVEKKKAELQACEAPKKTVVDEVGALQKEASTFQAESAKEKTAWEAEIATLQEKLKAASPICNYLKPGASVQGLCPEKKEEPKVEPPKAEEKKAEEAPKQEAPKQEAPKQEAPKPEAPKPEAPKPEAPKPEAPKPEAPKPEAPKPEAPKPEEPKAPK